MPPLACDALRSPTPAVVEFSACLRFRVDPRIWDQVPNFGTIVKIMSALTNAIEILRCFSTRRPDLSFADVMALTGKPKSSTSRLLRSLRDCGLLEQDTQTRRYRPGLLTFELGRLHRAHDGLIAVAERELREVCARTGHTGYIAVLDGCEQVVLRIVPGSNPLRVVNPPGQRTTALPPRIATVGSQGFALAGAMTSDAARTYRR